MDSLAAYVARYRNTGELNDQYYEEFTRQTNAHALLKRHRDYIEQHKLGFGDRAFHFMWYELLKDLRRRKQRPALLEIGVYKGQVISLWSLLSKEFGMEAEISAITPLKGNVSLHPLINQRWINALRRVCSPSFRKRKREGNMYGKEDYEAIIRSLFFTFGLSFDDIHLFKGYSSDKKIVGRFRNHVFDLVYIDGDHSFEGVTSDIRNYSSLIDRNGYLVMDDASYFLAGSRFWKGRREVSRASEMIDGLGFKNILNIGHNRVYQRT
jgi:hypothetical protein